MPRGRDGEGGLLVTTLAGQTTTGVTPVAYTGHGVRGNSHHHIRGPPTRPHGRPPAVTWRATGQARIAPSDHHITIRQLHHQDRHRQPNYRYHGPPKGPRGRRQRHHRPNSKARHRPRCYRTNRPDMQGSKQERRPQDWQHHGAPRPPTATSTNTTAHHTSTIVQPGNQRQPPTSNPRPPSRAQVVPSWEE